MREDYTPQHHMCEAPTIYAAMNHRCFILKRSSVCVCMKRRIHYTLGEWCCGGCGAKLLTSSRNKVSTPIRAWTWAILVRSQKEALLHTHTQKHEHTYSLYVYSWHSCGPVLRPELDGFKDKKRAKHRRRRRRHKS